jgi:hypothetical protein
VSDIALAAWGADCIPEFQEAALEEIAEMISKARKRRGPKSQTTTLVLAGVTVEVEVRRVSE